MEPGGDVPGQAPAAPRPPGLLRRACAGQRGKSTGRRQEPSGSARRSMSNQCSRPSTSCWRISRSRSDCPFFFMTSFAWSCAANFTAARITRIRPAPADVAGQAAGDVLLGGIRVFLEQADRRDDHSRRAVATLERLDFEKRGLDRDGARPLRASPSIVVIFFPTASETCRAARARRPSVEEDRARAALSLRRSRTSVPVNCSRLRRQREGLSSGGASHASLRAVHDDVQRTMRASLSSRRGL